MDEVILPAIRPAALDLVARHRADGTLCAIVTATNEFVTAPIARRFGIEHLIATRLEERDGRYTGRPYGTPTYRDGKVVRTGEWLIALGHDWQQLRALLVLQRLGQRHPAAVARLRPGRHQPGRAPDGPRATSTAGPCCDCSHDREAHRPPVPQTLQPAGRSLSFRAHRPPRPANPPATRPPSRGYASRTYRPRRSAPARPCRRTASRPSSSAAACATCCSA